MQSQIRFLVESYYDVQKLRVETFNRIVAYAKSHLVCETHNKHASQTQTEPHEPCASQQKGETHFDTAVKPSILAHQIVTLKTEPPKEISELVWYHNSLYETEKQLAKRLDAWSNHHPLRINFLHKTRGIGPILSSGLIAWLSPINRFETISKLWKYCGLAPGQKRRKGERLGYNPHLKTLMWKIACSFEKQNSGKSQYRRLYERQKNYYLNREDLKLKEKEKGFKGHIRNMTLRYTVKRFLADLWIFWRRMEGLSLTKPYAIDVLKHEHYQQWVSDAEDQN